jgi:hypothetical protein
MSHGFLYLERFFIHAVYEAIRIALVQRKQQSIWRLIYVKLN